MAGGRRQADRRAETREQGRGGGLHGVVEEAQILFGIDSFLARGITMNKM